MVDSLLNYGVDFVVNWTQNWRFIGVTNDHDILDYYCTFGVSAVNDAQTVWVNTACEADHSQKNISIRWYHNVYN